MNSLQVMWAYEDTLDPEELTELVSSDIVDAVEPKSMKVDIKKAANNPKELLRLIEMFQEIANPTVKLANVPPNKLKIIIDVLNKADWVKDHTLKIIPKRKKFTDVSFGVQLLRAVHLEEPANTRLMKKFLESLL